MRRASFNLSSLSSFSDIEPREVVGTKFQILSLDKENSKENAASISSYKDSIKVVKDDTTNGWGQIEISTNNKDKTGVGFSPASSKSSQKDKIDRPIQETFHNGGFLLPI